MLQLHLPNPPALLKSGRSERKVGIVLELYVSRLLPSELIEKVRRFDPELHPRWPAGDGDRRGGRFRPKDDDFFLPASDRHDDDDNLPPNRRPTRSELNRYARKQSAIEAHRVTTGIKTKAQAIGEFLDRIGVSDELGNIFSRFLSRFDNPVSLEELIKQTQTGEQARSLPGYETHHIVERGPNDGRFSEEQLEGPENVVRIPYYKHRDISDYYSTKNDELGGMTPRDYLRGKSFEEQRQFGIDTMRKFKVIK